jgi:hypothetical protein
MHINDDSKGNDCHGTEEDENVENLQTDKRTKDDQQS